MKIFACLVGAALLVSCSTNGGPGFRMRVNPVIYGAHATLGQWQDGTDLWQLQYIGALVEAGNQHGLRCPGSLTVGTIRNELYTRLNQGRTGINNTVISELDKILADYNCGVTTAAGLVPLTTMYPDVVK